MYVVKVSPYDLSKQEWRAKCDSYCGDDIQSVKCGYGRIHQSCVPNVIDIRFFRNDSKPATPSMNVKLYFELLLVVTLVFVKSGNSYQLLYHNTRSYVLQSITPRGYASSNRSKSLLFIRDSNRSSGLNAGHEIFVSRMKIVDAMSSDNKIGERSTLPDGHLYVPEGTARYAYRCVALIFLLDTSFTHQL